MDDPSNTCSKKQFKGGWMQWCTSVAPLYVWVSSFVYVNTDTVVYNAAASCRMNSAVKSHHQVDYKTLWLHTGTASLRVDLNASDCIKLLVTLNRALCWVDSSLRLKESTLSPIIMAEKCASIPWGAKLMLPQSTLSFFLFFFVNVFVDSWRKRPLHHAPKQNNNKKKLRNMHCESVNTKMEHRTLASHVSNWDAGAPFWVSQGAGVEKICTNSHKKRKGPPFFLWLLMQFFFNAPLSVSRKSETCSKSKRQASEVPTVEVENRSFSEFATFDRVCLPRPFSLP